MPSLRPCRLLLLPCLAVCMAATAHAQGRGGHGGMGGGSGRMGGMRIPGEAPVAREDSGTPGMRESMAGRWWDNKRLAKSLDLKNDQQKRMDHLFTQNRDVLQQRYDAFVKEQGKLNHLKRSNTASESELFTQIEHTAQARTDLEQAYTHMQLQIRNELTAEQIHRIDEQH